MCGGGIWWGWDFGNYSHMVIGMLVGSLMNTFLGRVVMRFWLGREVDDWWFSWLGFMVYGVGG